MTTPDLADALLGLDPRLHGYQVRAARHLWENPRAALFLEMGLGKTAIVLSSLTPEHLPALVVGPKRVAEHVWTAEAKKWRPDLSVAVAAGTPTQRKAAIAAGADITTLGVANLANARPLYKTVILDESSLFKDPSTNRWSAAKALTRFVDNVWLLTGTPTPNGLIDLWAQIYLLDHGKRLGGGKRFGTGITQYRDRWFVKGFNGYTYEPRDEAADEILSRIDDVCLSMRTEDYLELPLVTYNTVELGLPTAALTAYETMRDELYAELVQGEDVLAANAAVKTGKLAQITAGFLYDENKDVHWLHDEKISALGEIIDGTSTPVLVFYRFVAEFDAMRKAFPTARSIKEPGVIDAWNAGDVPILLAHPASAGHGLNLQDSPSTTIVWTSLSWSSEQWSQANARLIRQGQRQRVIVHTLEAAEVDKEMAAVVQGKISVQDAVMRTLRA